MRSRWKQDYIYQISCGHGHVAHFLHSIAREGQDAARLKRNITVSILVPLKGREEADVKILTAEVCKSPRGDEHLLKKFTVIQRPAVLALTFLCLDHRLSSWLEVTEHPEPDVV